MDSEQKQFIGPRQVKTVETLEKTTPEGATLLKVTFEGDYSEVIPQEMFDATVTEIPSDFNALAERRKKLVTGKIMGILKESNVNLSELNDIFKFVGFQSDIHFDKASNYLWTKDDNEFVPGMPVMARRTFLEAQDVIDSIPKHVEQASETVSAEVGANGDTAVPTGDVAPEGAGTPTPDA